MASAFGLLVSLFATFPMVVGYATIIILPILVFSVVAFMSLWKISKFIFDESLLPSFMRDPVDNIRSIFNNRNELDWREPELKKELSQLNRSDQEYPPPRAG